MKQPVITNELMERSSKINRRVLREFWMFRSAEAQGTRRIHSTTSLNGGKKSSLISSKNPWLSGQEEIEKLQALKQNLIKNKVAYNLSEIMSDPNFLIASWAKIRSNKCSITPAFENTLDGIKEECFVKMANGMRNGKFKFSPAKRIYIPKSNGEFRPLTMPSPRDKIVQEGMKFLLEIVFESEFRDSSHGFRPNKGCHTALKDIKKKCKAVSWYIEGDIEQQFPSLDHTILVSILKKKIKDQAFIDLIYKYLRNGFGETPKKIIPMKTGVIQGGILSPILSNIYMTLFDQYVKDILIPQFKKGIKRKPNPEYYKKYYENNIKVKDKSIRSVIGNDPNWKRAFYFRYADDFILAVDGNKNDCIKLRTLMQKFLNNELKLVLNVEKTKITHAETRSAKFLGYKIHKTKLRKITIKKDCRGKVTRRVPRPVLDAPIHEIVKKLMQRGYAKNKSIPGKSNQTIWPTRNGRFINLTLDKIIDHYKMVERVVLNYYSLANNYRKLAGIVHYLLKYSCVLTIASKMKLKTMKKVFRKYGKKLSIKKENGKIVSYTAPSYKRPNYVFNAIEKFDEEFIDKLHFRLNRGRKDLANSCAICGATENIEVHHVRALRKNGSVVRKEFISVMMSKINRKQIPVCTSCHKNIHRGKYDGPSFKI